MHQASNESLITAMMREIHGHDIIKATQESGKVDEADFILLREISFALGRDDLFSTLEFAALDLEQLQTIPEAAQSLKELKEDRHKHDIDDLEKKAKFVPLLALVKMGYDKDPKKRKIVRSLDEVSDYLTKGPHYGGAPTFRDHLEAGVPNYAQKATMLGMLRQLANGAKVDPDTYEDHKVLGHVFENLGWGEPFPGRDARYEWFYFEDTWSLQWELSSLKLSDMPVKEFMDLISIKPHAHREKAPTEHYGDLLRRRAQNVSRSLENLPDLQKLASDRIDGAHLDGCSQQERHFLEKKSDALMAEATMAIASGLALALLKTKSNLEMGRSHTDQRRGEHFLENRKLLHVELDTTDLQSLKRFAKTATLMKIDWDSGNLNLDKTLEACRAHVGAFIRQKVMPRGISDKDIRMDVAKADPETQAIAFEAAFKQGWEMLHLGKEDVSLTSVVKHFAAARPLMVGKDGTKGFSDALDSFTRRPELRMELAKMAGQVSKIVSTDEEGRIVVGEQEVLLSSLMANRIAAVDQLQPEKKTQGIYRNVVEEMSLTAWSTFSEAAGFISDQDVEEFFERNAAAPETAARPDETNRLN